MCMNAADSDRGATLGRAVPLGHHFEGLGPIPPVPEHTRWFEAGPLLIGVEHRALNEAILGDNFAGERRDALDAAVTASHGDDDVEDEGVSFHISDSATGIEYLRLDCFDGDPHYHYICGGSHSITVAYDEDADGDMVAWALGRLRDRLAPMLRVAQAEHLADRLEQDRIDAVLPAIETLAGGLRSSPGR